MRTVKKTLIFRTLKNPLKIESLRDLIIKKQ